MTDFPPQDGTPSGSGPVPLPREALPPAKASQLPPDARLGLALSGGGFRASLFHLGVLRRLAELDVLPSVAVISSVSGGSLLSALYMLHLKGHRERAGASSAPLDYVAIVDDVERDVRHAMSRALRNRLLLNPWHNLRMLFWRFSLTDRMAGLYERHLYARATAALGRPAPRATSLDVRLHEMRFSIPGATDIERHNADHPRERIPKVVLNASCLNTGRTFLFTFVEIGDPRLGYLRFDERYRVLGYKRLLSLSRERHFTPELTLEARRAADGASTRDGEREEWDFRRETLAHLVWWTAASGFVQRLEAEPWQGSTPKQREGLFNVEAKRARDRLGSGASVEIGEPVGTLLGDWDASLRLRLAEPELLRRAKISAWCLLQDGWGDAPRWGFTAEQHHERLWSAVRDIDEPLGARLRGTFGGAPLGPSARAFHEFVLDLYYFRSAEGFAWTAPEAMARFTLAQAAACSANFPPVFAPYKLYDLYDEERIGELALSDGGINDNRGIETLIEEGCTHIIASDASAAENDAPVVRWNRLGMLGQIIFNMLPIVGRLQLEKLHARRKLSEGIEAPPPLDQPPQSAAHAARLDAWRAYRGLRSVAFFQIDSDPNDALPVRGRDRHPLWEEIAHTRTDLDGFGRIEIDALLYQGYQLGDLFVRRYLAPAPLPDPALPAGGPPVIETGPGPTRVLESAHARLFRALRPNRWWRVGLLAGATALIAIKLLVLRLLAPWPADAGRALWRLLDRTTIWRPAIAWILASETRKLAVVGVALAIVVGIAWPRGRMRRPRSRVWSGKSGLAWHRRAWGSALIGWLWFLGLSTLWLLPIWIALALWIAWLLVWLDGWLALRAADRPRA